MELVQNTSNDLHVDVKVHKSNSPVDFDESPGNTASSSDSSKENSPRPVKNQPKVYKTMALISEAISSYDPCDEQLPQLEEVAWDVRENAYCPYSGFKVGAAIRSANTGKIYRGCNVENAAFPTGVCAERGALCTAIAAEGPNLKLDHVMIATEADTPAQPCGPCR